MPHLINDLMILDTFTRMFSQRTRVQQSMSGSNKYNSRVSYAKYDAIGLISLLGSGDNNTSNTGALKSALSNLDALNCDHPLARQVQQNAGI